MIMRLTSTMLVEIGDPIPADMDVNEYVREYVYWKFGKLL